MLALLSAMVVMGVLVCWSCTVSAGAVVMSTLIVALAIAANFDKRIREMYCTGVFVVVTAVVATGVDTGTGTGGFGTGTGTRLQASIVI
jgi:hypothetical protein